MVRLEQGTLPDPGPENQGSEELDQEPRAMARAIGWVATFDIRKRLRRADTLIDQAATIYTKPSDQEEEGEEEDEDYSISLKPKKRLNLLEPEAERAAISEALDTLSDTGKRKPFSPTKFAASLADKTSPGGSKRKEAIHKRRRSITREVLETPVEDFSDRAIGKGYDTDADSRDWEGIVTPARVKALRSRVAEKTANKRSRRQPQRQSEVKNLIQKWGISRVDPEALGSYFGVDADRLKNQLRGEDGVVPPEALERLNFLIKLPDKQLDRLIAQSKQDERAARKDNEPGKIQVVKDRLKVVGAEKVSAAKERFKAASEEVKQATGYVIDDAKLSINGIRLAAAQKRLQKAGSQFRKVKGAQEFWGEPADYVDPASHSPLKRLKKYAFELNMSDVVETRKRRIDTKKGQVRIKRNLYKRREDKLQQKQTDRRKHWKSK